MDCLFRELSLPFLEVILHRLGWKWQGFKGLLPKLEEMVHCLEWEGQEQWGSLVWFWFNGIFLGRFHGFIGNLLNQFIQFPLGVPLGLLEKLSIIIKGVDFGIISMVNHDVLESLGHLGK